MKPFRSQTYYELLEISVSATPVEIRGAYDRLSRLYADDQVALYGLSTRSNAGDLRKALAEAMEMLLEDDLRAEYDKSIGLPPRELPPVAVVAVAPPPAPPVVAKVAAAVVDAEEVPSVSAQLALDDVLLGADRAMHSTLPRVPFTWAEPGEEAVPVVSAAPPGPVPVLAPAVSAPPPPPVVVMAPAVSAPPPPPVTVMAAAISAPPPPPAPQPGSVVAVPPPLPVLAVKAPELPKLPPPSIPAPLTSAPRARPYEIPPDAEFNGETLRRVRESLEITLPALAEKTRIGVKHLENIEADRYDALPVAVYLRGFLMSLARELKLDGLRLSKSYLALVERHRTKG